MLKRSEDELNFVGNLSDHSVIQAVTLLVPKRAAKRNPVLPIGK